MTGVLFDPNAIYDDNAILTALDVGTSTLTNARRDGSLRYTRKGKRTLYLGRWVLDWLLADEPQEAAHA